ncbi:MAG: efflux RND transporter periplasmic adaptor subunit [Bacteroidia bacterium]|nr:efflux RND transporter periplasmic adaptor subunit [Bacteroidia bacterium]
MQINIPTEKLTSKGSKVVRKLKNANRPPRWAIYLSAAVFIFLLGLIVYIKWPKPQPPVYPTVQAEPLTVEDVEIYVEYAGKIKAKQHVEIRSRVEGYLERMFFEEGGYVKKNALLFSIDPKLYRASVEKARAQLNKNIALKQKAERALMRIRPLYQQNAASQLDLDNAIAAFEAAQAEVTMSEADLAQAEIALSYTEVRSPISGFISESSADIGTLVGPGGKSLLATVVNSDTVEVNFSMTGLDYLKSKERNVNLGKRIEERNWNPYITITLADNTEYPIKGIVDFADPKVDPNTGTFSVRAQMPNPDHILLPGQLTKVRLLMDVHENAIVVPKKALVIEKGGAYVFVVRKDLIVEKRFVELGPEVNNRAVVERGLGSDEMIIVEGFHKLSHGMRVNLVN